MRPAAPFVYLEMDIKYLYIKGEGRTIFLLTIIDTHSRHVLDYALGYQMTQVEVKELWRRGLQQQVFTDDGLVAVSNVSVSSDNGSQFIAHSVREFFTQAGITQEFTHVATPEENAHIESFHSILQEALVGIEFTDREEVLTGLANRILPLLQRRAPAFQHLRCEPRPLPPPVETWLGRPLT